MVVDAVRLSRAHRTRRVCDDKRYRKAAGFHHIQDCVFAGSGRPGQNQNYRGYLRG